MKQHITDKATATATLLISTDTEKGFSPKPEFRPEFEISRDAYERLPRHFTLTELPLPAVVAADCIENYEAHLGSIPEEERAEYDLDVEDRWGDQAAVQRFMDRVLRQTFDGEHFTVVAGAEHILVGGLYMMHPTYSFQIADADGKVVDFYSAPGGFEQPIRIEARVQVTRPSLLQAV
ncbi:hypothetical protein Poly30_32530 [Planctomycetes bacterium Poly30]|uniref:Uncharacterized protein n=1 Tax=Saltatorellus ferox TaxID=2528018 RepID=A0A518EUF6_9BACT|nr:hypothetical protein Poly30_32530 [Planctomycetes bacterium Poly30]